MDYLTELWDLYENDLTQRVDGAVDRAQQGKTDLRGGSVSGGQIQRKPQPKPELRDPVDSTPAKARSQVNPEINTRNKQTQDINTARQQGTPPGDAYEKVKGEVDTSNPSSVGDFAATLSMTQMDRSQAPKIEPGSQSLLAKDVDQNQNQTLPDDGDLKRPEGMEISDEDEQENQQAGDTEKLETSPRATDALEKSVPEFAQGKGFQDQLSTDTDSYLENLKTNNHGNGAEYVDLRSSLGDMAPSGVAGKYLDVLSRALVTKNVKGKTDNWKHYGGDLKGGAGQINSQMGELLTLTMSNVAPENREQVAEVIRNQIKAAESSGSKKKDLSVTEDWLDASLENAQAIDQYMQFEAPGSTIVGGAWDQPDELESLGIGGEGGEEKGFSTDIVVRGSDGKNHQLSLKKDGNVNFLNSGAGQYSKYYLSGAAEDPSNPHHETAKEYLSSVESVNNIYSELGIDEYDGESLPNVPSEKSLINDNGLSKEEAKKTRKELQDHRNKLSEIKSNQDIVPKEYNLSEYNKQENESLTKSFGTLGDEIRSLDLNSLNTSREDIFSDAFNEDNFSEDIKDKFFDSDGEVRSTPKGITKNTDKEEYNRAKSLLQQSAKDAKSGEVKGKVESLMKEHNISDWKTFVDRLEGNDIPGLSQRERNKLMMNSIFATKSDTAKEHRTQMKQRERDFASSAIKAISSDPVMKSGTLNSLRKNFPLKDVAEGKESMIIGNSTFSKKVLEKMFGTTDFNQIKDKLVVQTDSKGIPYLGYQVEVDSNDDGETEETIPISNINVRADGLGYGNTIKHEMKLRPDFYKRLQKVNAEMGTNVTAEEVLSLFFGKRELFIESIQHLIPKAQESIPLDISEQYDYNDDVDFLRTYGRA